DRRHVDDLDPAVTAQLAAERARDLAELHAPPLAEAPRRRPTIWGPVHCSRAARAPLLRCPQTPSARSSALALGLPPLLIWGPVRCSRAARAPLLRCPQTPSARSSALALGLPPFLIRGPVRCSRARPPRLPNVHALGSPPPRRAC